MSQYKSQYEEMCAEAKKWIERRQRSREYMLKLVTGFVEHCQIPKDKIRFLRWNGAAGLESIYSEAEDGRNYSPVSAMVFDEENGSWNMGVSVLLEPASMFFPLIVSERGGMPTAQVGANGKAFQIDLNNPPNCFKFYAAVAEIIKEGFGEDKKLPIGFSRQNDSVEAKGETA